jgi:hypothetical protein
VRVEHQGKKAVAGAVVLDCQDVVGWKIKNEVGRVKAAPAEERARLPVDFTPEYAPPTLARMDVFSGVAWASKSAVVRAKKMPTVSRERKGRNLSISMFSSMPIARETVEFKAVPLRV